MNKKLNPLTLMLMMVLYPQAHASIVRDDIGYQIYRDFAENKGIFYPGALNISIHDINGNLIGMLDKAPMPDFSATDTLGIATLVNPQYIMSVKHNAGYDGVLFGGAGSNPDYDRHKYMIVARNEVESVDLHTPRLDKVVTEVAPITSEYIVNVDGNTKPLSVLYRIGSGTQYVCHSCQPGQSVDINNPGDLKAAPYAYLTGGSVYLPSDTLYGSEILGEVGISTDSDPLWNFSQPGDSGSPLFAWDASKSKWVLVGVLHGVINRNGRNGNVGVGEGTRSIWESIPDGILFATMNDDSYTDKDFPIMYSPDTGDLHWTYDSINGTGAVKNSSIAYGMRGPIDNDQNNGKNQFFDGEKGIVILDNNVDQGAGTLTFNADYTVRPSGDETWKGGGIIVNADKTVTWQVNGVAGDSLHKIGTGTLKVNAMGDNPGELSVGDGTVILDQQADSAGKKQAFSKIDIVSGRPTVVLNDASQIETNNIYFGFRGGRLDLNGNDLNFTRIKAVDSGAQLVNHHSQVPASLTINGPDNTVFPGYLGEDDATKTNGELNVRYAPATADSVLTLAGGANLNGTLTVDKGAMLLSGQPVLHADNKTFDDDWHSSDFTVKDIHVGKDAQFQVGEYARLQGNIQAGERSQTVLGYFDDGTQNRPLWRCTLDDNTGESHCNNPSRDDAQFSVLSPSVVTGDITLADNATLSLGKVIYTGHLDGSAASVVTMGRDSLWNMTTDSQAGTLAMAPDSQITFSSFPHTLTISNLTGNGGTINLNTALAGSSSPSDKIIINGGAATGHTHLQVHNQGGLGAQTTGDGIQLVEAIHGGTTARDAFNMPGELVAGAWRYNLYRKSGDEGWYLTTDKLNLAMTPLTPAKVTVPMTSLTPAKVTVPMTSLTPAKVTVPMTSLTPAKVTVPMTSLTPAKVTVPMTSLTPAIVTIQAQVNDLQQRQNITNDSHVKVSTDQSVNWSGSLSGQGMLTKEGAGDLTLDNSQVAQKGGVMLNEGNLILSGTEGTFDVVAKEGTQFSLANHSVLTGTVDPTDLSVDSSSVWNITGDSLLNAFRNDGVVTFVSPAPGAPFVPHTLTVDSLSGQGGTINLNTWLEGSDSPTDKVVIDGGAATGHTHLVVHNQGGLGAATTGNGIQLVSAVNGGTTADDTFDMPDKLAAGSWRYSLWRNPNDEGWYLSSSSPDGLGNEWVRSGHPDYSDAAWSFAGLTTQAMSYERLIANTGDSRTEEGMWSRVEGGRLHQGQDVGSTPSGDAAGEANYAVIQVGGDIGSVETPTSLWRVGLYGATAQTRGHSSRDNGEQAGSVSDQIFSTGAYVHGQYHHGLYVDGQVQVSRHRLNVSLNDSQGRLTTRGSGLNLSTTVGRELHAGGMDITPQAQYMVQSLQMDSEVDTAGTRYEAENSTRQQLQVGVKVAHLLAGTGKDDKSVRVWMMPSVLQSFGQRGNTQVGVDGRDETTVTFGPGSEGAAAGVDVGIESHISQQGKVNPDVLVGVRGRYQRGLSGSEPDGVGGQVTFKMMF